MSNSVVVLIWGLTALSCWIFQYFLRSGNIVQKIYDLSPESHQKKKFTPTMGGVVFIPILLISIGCLGGLSKENIWIMMILFCFGAIGLWDDLASLKKGRNQGLSARLKFLMQLSLSMCLLISFNLWISEVPLLWWEWPLYLFIFVGTSNATNLSDGLDGLLSGLAIITFWGFYSLGPAVIQVHAILAVATLSGFLMINHHPAKLFMGDTGSLALGALMAGLAILMRDAFILIPLGAVYILETLSVLVQVSYFKYTRKRIFLMSPLHHHFELMGLSELTVVRLFWAIGVCFILFYVGLSA